jgi:hypothetical protein
MLVGMSSAKVQVPTGSALGTGSRSGRPPRDSLPESFSSEGSSSGCSSSVDPSPVRASPEVLPPEAPPSPEDFSSPRTDGIGSRCTWDPGRSRGPDVPEGLGVSEELGVPGVPGAPGESVPSGLALLFGPLSLFGLPSLSGASFFSGRSFCSASLIAVFAVLFVCNAIRWRDCRKLGCGKPGREK